MELGKYKQAMRPKKYLTREFVVYKETPEAMDDVITEEQDIIETMPSQAPAMDNVMPSEPGMEDPRLRQIALADGGIVEREGFKNGINYTRNPTGKNQYEQKSIEEIINIIKNNPKYNAKDLRGKTKVNKIPLLTRTDIERAKEVGVEPGFSGKHVDPEKQRARDFTRRESIKAKSSPAMEKELRGTKEKNLSHAGRKNTPVNLGNLMYADASLNREMLYPFEKPLEEAMTKFEQVYNSDASPEVKRKAAVELQKFDRELRQKYPEYAKLKTRFQFKNSAFEPGFVFKEKLPNPSLAISNEPGTFLQGVNPKSKKGEALIKIGKEKLETIVNNIGCPTGTLKAANGANCYVKGMEKIQSGNLNKNEFNILQKAVKSPAAVNAIKYGGVALKGLGAILTPLMFYDTYSAYKEGKPISEALEYGLLGTNILGSIRDESKLTPQEREARGATQQYEREQDDISGLSSDFYVPSTLSTSEAAAITKQAEDRIAAERAAEEKQRAAEIDYQGDPGIQDDSGLYAYGGRVGLKDAGDPKDKPILPINPMMDEGPQDPSKREFLKGAGGIGLAGLLVGTGLLKLGKSAAVSSKISSMIKNTTAPSWMEALITKVMKEGTDSPVNYIGRNKFSSAPDDKVITKELKFKNPETGQMEEVRLRINQDKDTINVDYLSGSGNTVADQGVTFEISPQKEIILSKDGKYLTSNPVKGQYDFHAIEAEPRVVNWDGDIEWDGEAARKKIIYLNSDISGLKSFVTGGKGIDKKVAKAKREAADYVEKNPNEYLENAYDPMSIDTSYYND